MNSKNIRKNQNTVYYKDHNKYKPIAVIKLKEYEILNEDRNDLYKQNEIKDNIIKELKEKIKSTNSNLNLSIKENNKLTLESFILKTQLNEIETKGMDEYLKMLMSL